MKSCFLSQNLLFSAIFNWTHVRQHHILYIEKWCSYDIQHTMFAFPATSHDSCHHVSQCYTSEVFLFDQVLQDDHGSPDNGTTNVDETSENPMASHVLRSCQAFCKTNSEQNKRGLEYHFFTRIDARYSSMFSSALSKCWWKHHFIDILITFDILIWRRHFDHVWLLN